MACLYYFSFSDAREINPFSYHLNLLYSLYPEAIDHLMQKLLFVC
jgi:hypothetical protein